MLSTLVLNFGHQIFCKVLVLNTDSLFLLTAPPQNPCPRGARPREHGRALLASPGRRRRGPRRVRVSVGRLPGGRSRRRLAARDARRLRPQLRRGARGPGRRVHNRSPDLAPETRKRCGGLARRAASGVDVRHGPHEGRPRH